MKITDEKGEIKLSPRKIFNMALIVLFFSGVAHRWERRQRRAFEKAVDYKAFDEEKLRKILEDFNILSSCQDPYIENFYKKHPEFSKLNKLWVLNSYEYWTKR
jgi:hypothetical protein